ncbi:MAG: dihydropteroate synthase [Saprospiraceae bacterium]|jgi:dihydropteroate synthase
MIGDVQYIFRVGDRIVDFKEPQVMGIINVTPDSFYASSRHTDIDPILNQVGKMLDEGATIIDIGAVSSRPGAQEVSEEEEFKRLIPAVSAIRNQYADVIISVDTYRSKVLKAAYEAGADMINDISGGLLDPDLLPTVAEIGLPYILMHMKGSPEHMQDDPNSADIVMEVLTWLTNRLYYLYSIGIHDVIIDPGFGFGKRLEHNYELLRSLDTFQILNAPIMAGLSRKSMIYKALDITPEEALTGTIGANMLALQRGAKILRVHDVLPAVQTIRIFHEYQGKSSN